MNGTPVADVIDVQFYAAEESLTLQLRRDGALLEIEAERAYNQPLGLAFEHPTFDIDIRRCNNLCEFCFVLQMAPRFRRTLYIKDDDYRYSFLFGHYVTLTNLTDHDWWRIEHMALSPLYVSVHVTDLERRRRFLRNDEAPDIMDQLRWLAARGIQVHTQLVIVPTVNDGEWLERSVTDLETLWPAVASISVVPVGLTRQHKYGLRPNTPAEGAVVLDFVGSRQRRYRREFGVRFVYPSDEWFLLTGRPIPELDYYEGLDLRENGLGMVRHFLAEWEALQSEIVRWQAANPGSDPSPGFRRITLVTGTLFAPVLRRTAQSLAEFTGRQITVAALPNQTFGGTITAAGLLQGQDVLAQLPGLPPADLIVLPRIMFDHPDRITLDNHTPQAIANALDRPVALADVMGDVWDAIRGQSQVLFLPPSMS